MKSHKFIDYTYLEIKSLIDAGCLAIVPTGCTERQGPHLAVDFDTWFAETVTLEAAEYMTRCYDVRALVLPAMPFGPTPEHRGFGSGYVNIPHSVHEQCVYFVLESLAEQGFDTIVVWARLRRASTRGGSGQVQREILPSMRGLPSPSAVP